MKALFVIGFIVLPFAIGGNFTCYNCRACGDPFNTDFAKQENCSSACAKAVIVANNGTTATVRSCREVYDGEENSSPELPTDVAEVHYYQCKENLCNGAFPMAPASLLLTIFIAIWILVDGFNYQ